MDAITICAVNYLPFVRVLGKSFLDKNPGSTFSVLVIDSEKVEFEKDRNFNFLSPSDLDIPQEVFQNMAFYYDVTELATALKPSALKALINNGSKKVIYLDPDIQVFSEFSELDKLLESYPIILTPHTLTPIPRDGFKPSESDIMGSGTFNLGFLALTNSEISLSFLDWWEDRLRFDSISDPVQMLFTDQRWIDLVPSYFPIEILRHPGYNVAYWNLQERVLGKTNGNIMVNGFELKFFHFSGYRPDKPWILSKYVSDNPRIVISEDPILKDLCINYGEKAIENGWENELSVSYGYQNFENGKLIPSSIRRLYRDDCIKAHKENEVQTPPESWRQWACDRSLDSGNLSRILYSLWKSRPDLQQRFPDAPGLGANNLLNWAKTHGISEKVIDEEFLEIGHLQNDVIPLRFSKQMGINLAGYLTGELGLGQSARLILEAAKSTGLPITTLNSNRTSSRQEESIGNLESEVFYPITISVINADHFKFWVQDVGTKNIRKTYVIGVWAWETEDFPVHMHPAFDYVDEIWAVSTFVKSAISRHTKKPVFVIPTPIIRPSFIEKLDRNRIGIGSETKYNLFIFDYKSVFNRKNPLGLVQAHIAAYPNQDGPKLIIKSTNGNTDAVNREKLKYAINNRSDILLFEEYLSRGQLTALINECEIYISLHRSEGYGLTMAEAMALGKPVIATEYSGNLDFMDGTNSLLVPFNLVEIGSESFPYDPKSKWADPDLAFASKLIIETNANIDSSLKTYADTSQDLIKSHSIDKSRQFILKRIETNLKITNRFQQIMIKFIKFKFKDFARILRFLMRALKARD